MMLKKVLILISVISVFQAKAQYKKLKIPKVSEKTVFVADDLQPKQIECYETGKTFLFEWDELQSLYQHERAKFINSIVEKHHIAHQSEP